MIFIVEIILVRSAESVAQSEGIYQGQTVDTELTDRGESQAALLAKKLGSEFGQVDTIYTSPLIRVIRTAETVAKGLLIAEPVIDKRLIELDRGAWDGKTIDDVKDSYEDLYKQYLSDPESVTMPNGESIEDMRSRVWDFWNYLENQELNRVVVVSHDIVIRVTLTKLLRRSLRDMWMFGLDSGGFSVIEWSKNPQVISVNVDEHLEKVRSDLGEQAL